MDAKPPSQKMPPVVLEVGGCDSGAVHSTFGQCVEHAAKEGLHVMAELTRVDVPHVQGVGH